MLKADNLTQLLIPGVQDYLLKENIVSDTFAFDVLNAIALKMQEDENKAYKSDNLLVPGFPSSVWGKDRLNRSRLLFPAELFVLVFLHFEESPVEAFSLLSTENNYSILQVSCLLVRLPLMAIISSSRLNVYGSGRRMLTKLDLPHTD